MMICRNYWKSSFVNYCGICEKALWGKMYDKLMKCKRETRMKMSQIGYKVK